MVLKFSITFMTIVRCESWVALLNGGLDVDGPNIETDRFLIAGTTNHSS